MKGLCILALSSDVHGSPVAGVTLVWIYSLHQQAFYNSLELNLVGYLAFACKVLD